MAVGNMLSCTRVTTIPITTPIIDNGKDVIITKGNINDSNTVEVVAPITGTIIDITDVPDPVFAKKSVGDGFGISAPPGGTVVSPVTGTVMMVAKTLHAVGIKTESGLQFLVHLGIDTVELDGNPFTLTVTKGDKVEAGQIIGTMDVEAIKECGKDTTIVVAVTNIAKKFDHIDIDKEPAEARDKVAVAHAKVKPDRKSTV